jgi:ketol-acid reductoisomerase
VPGKNLFDVDEAISRGTVVMNLLSDAAQSETWPAIKPQLKGKTLYFSHGFSPVFKDLTKVEVPSDIDVILVAPKGSGRTVRSLFKAGKGINSSIAVWQDVTGKAKEKAIALGVAVGSGYLYETTFQKEVYSDLMGERVSFLPLLPTMIPTDTSRAPSWAVSTVCSLPSTRSSVSAATPPLRPSTRPSRRPLSLCTL